jgi:intracellular sulfur oxidation DsrE/DsrF family protein
MVDTVNGLISGHMGKFYNDTGERKMFKRMITTMVLLMAFAGAVTPVAAHEKGVPYDIIFHVDENDKDKMNLVLNNVANVIKHFNEIDREVRIEVITYSGGLHMLREDTSPVKARVKSFAETYDNVSFAACGNTIKGMTKKEGKKPPLMKLDNIKVVPSGVIQILDRQDQGWHYIRP